VAQHGAYEAVCTQSVREAGSSVVSCDVLEPCVAAKYSVFNNHRFSTRADNLRKSSFSNAIPSLGRRARARRHRARSAQPDGNWCGRCGTSGSPSCSASTEGRRPQPIEQRLRGLACPAGQPRHWGDEVPEGRPTAVRGPSVGGQTNSRPDVRPSDAIVRRRHLVDRCRRIGPGASLRRPLRVLSGHGKHGSPRLRVPRDLLDAQTGDAARQGVELARHGAVFAGGHHGDTARSIIINKVCRHLFPYSPLATRG